MLKLERGFSPVSFYKYLKEEGCYPSLQNLISSQIDLFNWWKGSYTNYIIRHSKHHKKFKVINENGTTYFSSDNEACASFYEQIFKTPIRIKGDLFQFFKENQLKVGIKVEKSLGFKAGMANGICRRNELKLSHYMDAANNLSIKDSIKKRSAIYLSPLNIFLTPNPNKFHHYINGQSLYDLGEDSHMKEHLHSCLIQDLLTLQDGELAYKLYCEMCDLDFEEQLQKIATIERYPIQFGFKRKHNKSAYRRINKSKKSRLLETKNNGKQSIITQRNFILKKSYMGMGMVIHIVSKEGVKLFSYDHDKVLEQLGTRITRLSCWEKYGYYVKSGSVLPKFCAELETFQEIN